MRLLASVADVGLGWTVVVLGARSLWGRGLLVAAASA